MFIWICFVIAAQPTCRELKSAKVISSSWSVRFTGRDFVKPRMIANPREVLPHGHCSERDEELHQERSFTRDGHGLSRIADEKSRLMRRTNSETMCPLNT